MDWCTSFSLVYVRYDAEQYFNAWTTVFGRNITKKLLCSWHVDRAWRDSLAKHVQDKEK